MTHSRAGMETGNAASRDVQEFLSRTGSGNRPRLVRDQVIGHLEGFLDRGGTTSRWSVGPESGGCSQ